MRVNLLDLRLKDARRASFARSLLSFELRFVDRLLTALSMMALCMVVSTLILHPEDHIPLLDTTWGDLRVVVRTIIWSIFLADLVVYAFVYRRFLRYLKSHVLEIVVCVTWFPQATFPVLHLAETPFSVEFLPLLGTLAHGWRIVRWIAKEARGHPLLVTGSAAALLILNCAVPLHYFESETFPTYLEAAWYCLVTVTTIGYGDYYPQTGVGKLICLPLILIGLALYGTFIAVIQETVHKWLLASPDKGAPRLDEQLAESNRRLDAMATELAEVKSLLVRGLVDRAGNAGDGPPPNTKASPPEAEPD